MPDVRELSGPRPLGVGSTAAIPDGFGKQQECFSRALLHDLDRFAVRYCVLDPDGSGGDGWELAVHPQDEGILFAVFRALEEQSFLIVQEDTILAPGVRQYCFADMRSPIPSFETVTVITNSAPRKYLPAVEDMIERRRRRGSAWVAAANDELRYRIFKRYVRRRNFWAGSQGLQQWSSELGADLTKKQPADFKRPLSLRHLCNDPLEWITLLTSTIRNRCGLWLKPNGLVVAILGPDGAGKSSFSANLLKTFHPVFTSGRVLQWRPQVIKPRPEKNPLVFEPPHSKPAHGKTESVLRIIAVLLDYWVGQVALVKPVLAQSGLLIYDRSFHDILVDTVRYRYGGPRWVLHRVQALLPQSDVIFLTLEADPEVILQRKQEVSPGEVRRQCVEYRKLAHQLPDSHVIRTDRAFDQSLAEASRILVTYLNRRFKQRNKRSFALTESPNGVRIKRVSLSGEIPE